MGLGVRVGHGLSDRGVPLGYAGSLPIDRGTPLGFPGPVGTWWPADPGEGGPHPLRGQVLDPAVVLVAAHVLADRAGRQVTERPQSLVHRSPSLRGLRPDRPVPLLAPLEWFGKLDATVEDGDTISILPAVAGGA